MTRLTKQDIAGLEESIESYDILLEQKTGLNLCQIACYAAGISQRQFANAANTNKVSVVPITAGKGIISGFSETVASIIKHLGFSVNVTKGTDVSGIAEAINGANVTFMADDNRFIATNISAGTVIDNSLATARGYVSALNAMANGLNGREVLIIGAGRVGSEAIRYLQEIGANIAVYDPNLDDLNVMEKLDVKVEQDFYQSISLYEFILDASPEPSFIDLEHLHPNAVIAAPGIPLGVTTRVYKEFQERIVHDPLQLGVATMLALAIRVDQRMSP